MDNKDYYSWLSESKAAICIKNLVEHQFNAFYVEDTEKARNLILEIAGNNKSFGFGGSSTTRSLGLIEMLKDLNKTIVDHWADPNLSQSEILKIRLDQGRCDCFLTSANAISMTGEIVNVDGAGNRVSAMQFGPKMIIVVAGINKLTADLSSALIRIKEVAAPLRARSLGLNTPCAKTGICVDCNSPQRICRITTILHRKPTLTKVSVIIINKELGF